MISGKIGSGKDTTAGIVKRLLEERGCYVELAAFADPLKEAVAFMRGEDKGLFYSREGKDKDDEQIRRKSLVNVGKAMTDADPYVFARFVHKKYSDRLKGKKKAVLVVTDLRRRAEGEYMLDHNDIFTIRLSGYFEPCTIPEIATAPIECELDHLDSSVDNSVEVLTLSSTKLTDIGEELAHRNTALNRLTIKSVINNALCYFNID